MITKYNCDMVVELTVNTGFAFVFANVVVSKSRHRLFFYHSKERVKRIERRPFESFLSKGVDYGKGMC